MPKEIQVDFEINTDQELTFQFNSELKPTAHKVLVWPHAKLKELSFDISFKDTDRVALEQLTVDMLSIILDNNGLALAAPQIGLNKRIVVMLMNSKAYTLINPKVIFQSEEKFEWEEGCLSVPGYFKKNERSDTCVVEYFDIHGEMFTATFYNLASFAILHEIDHLDGICFTDDLSYYHKSKAKKVIKKTLKLRKEEAEKSRQLKAI